MVGASGGRRPSINRAAWSRRKAGRRLIGHTGDLASPIRLGTLGKQPGDLSFQRDADTVAHVVSGEAALPRRRQRTAAPDIAFARGGVDPLHEPVRPEVKVHRHSGTTGGKRGPRAGRAKCRPVDACARQQRGGKPDDFGQVALERRTRSPACPRWTPPAESRARSPSSTRGQRQTRRARTPARPAPSGSRHPTRTLPAGR